MRRCTEIIPSVSSANNLFTDLKQLSMLLKVKIIIYYYYSVLFQAAKKSNSIGTASKITGITSFHEQIVVKSKKKKCFHM